MADIFRQDLRQSLRSLRTAPGVTAAALLSLALGIGANTAIFSLINALMLKTLPVERPEQLLQVTNGTPQFFSAPMWEQIRDRQDMFSRLFAYGRWAMNLASGGEARPANGIFASGQYFETLGVRPALGRLLQPADDRRGCPGAAVLSYDFWQKEYGGRASVVGQTISLDNQPIPIAGVTEPGFTGLDVGNSFDVVVPLCAEKVIHGVTSNLDINAAAGNYNTIFAWLRIAGRPKPGVVRQQVDARLSALARQVYQATLPTHWRMPEQERYLRRRLTTESFAHGLSYIRDQYHDALLVLMATTGIVLLIACANVANLLLARGVARRREFAIRLALGAGRGRLVRQLLTESAVLAALAAALGVLIAGWVTRGLVVFFDASLDAAPDRRVLLYTSVVAAATSLAFGLAPAMRAASVGPDPALKARGIGHGSGFPAARVLVSVQIAFSLLLMAGAGLLVNTLWRLVSIDPGFAPRPVLMARVDARNTGIAPAARAGAFRRMLDRLRGTPGVAWAAAADVTPICGCASTRELMLDAASPAFTVHSNAVSEGYFTTLSTPLLSGRDFTAQDHPGTARVAIVNRTLAERYLGPRPLGRRFQLLKGKDLGEWVEVIGISVDAHYGSLREVVPPTVYFAWSQEDKPYPSTNFLLRDAGGAAGSLIAPAKAALAGVDPRLSLEFTPLSARIEESLGRERRMAALSTCFGVLALVLSVIGLYGVMSYSVARRGREIGIRMALGALPGRVLRMILWEVAGVIGAGLVLGTGLSAALGRYLAGLLYGLTPADPATFAAAALALSAVATLAAWVPARRAARVDPAAALREE